MQNDISCSVAHGEGGAGGGGISRGGEGSMVQGARGRRGCEAGLVLNPKP